MLFADRHEAGKRLGKLLLPMKGENPVVLALPRGGVPVGYEIAQALGAPLDIVLARKIGAPMQEELAIGAVVDGERPEIVTDSDLIAQMRVPPEYLEEAKAAALREIERRRHAYLHDSPPVEVAGRTAIITDDGIATGATMRAALRATRRRGPARLVLAVPVAPEDTLRRMKPEADMIVCPYTPVDFFGVGQFYRDFRQLRDEEVTALLDRARTFAPSTEARQESR
jgi:putative phosphoribosyl transferase